MEAYCKCPICGCFNEDCDRQMRVMDGVTRDANGEALYSAVCLRTGDMAYNVKGSELIYSKACEDKGKGLNAGMDKIIQSAVEKGVAPLAKQVARNTRSSNRNIAATTSLAHIVNHGKTSPHTRSKENEKCLKRALDYYWDLINKGEKKHNAKSMACKRVKKEIGLGKYKSEKSLWAALNDALKCVEHSKIPEEHSVSGKIRN